MRKKPDAYELEFNGSPNNVVKCEMCGFKCVYAQVLDNDEKCPKCGHGGNQNKGVERGRLRK